MKELHISMHEVPEIKGKINACIGYFDGLHKGHQELIQAVIKQSKRNGATPALITFSPDPWVVIKGIQEVPHITSMEDRKEIAEALGVELWIILDFTKEMAELNVAQFHQKVLQPLCLDTLVCGYDFHYAHFGKGSVSTLLEDESFTLIVIEEVSSEHAKISSSRIEECILQGNMEVCEHLLTRPYQIKGNVVHGLQNGRKMGFPTANLKLQDSYIIPKEGVYAGGVKWRNTWYGAMINVGKNPTFGDDKEASIEAHIFDFNHEIYGEQVSFAFYHYLRGDVKFVNMDSLALQLKQDQEMALQYYNTRKEEHSCV